MTIFLLLAALSAPDPASSIDKGVVQRVINRHLSRIRRCYEIGLQRNPNLAGTVVIKFTISNAGHVDQAAVKPGSTLDDEAVGLCVARSFLRMEFPEFKRGSGPIHVSYPFVFKPAD